MNHDFNDSSFVKRENDRLALWLTVIHRIAESRA